MNPSIHTLWHVGWDSMFRTGRQNRAVDQMSKKRRMLEKTLRWTDTSKLDMRRQAQYCASHVGRRDASNANLTSGMQRSGRAHTSQNQHSSQDHLANYATRRSPPWTPHRQGKKLRHCARPFQLHVLEAQQRWHQQEPLRPC